MLPSTLTLIGENRLETVFLPGVSFGYLYVEFNSITIFDYILPPVGGEPSAFLVLSILTFVVACFYYAMVDQGTNNIQSEIVYTVGISQFVFLLLSVLYLWQHVALGDLVVVGLFLLPIVLLCLTISERVVLSLND